jgi:type I protein arginine methyltransferase
MKSTVNKALGTTFKWTKKMLLSNKTISNAIMDVYNNDEFTDLYEHEKMLIDSVRINAYKKGIDRYIKPGETVVDLGTGSGILSFLASRKNPARIYAIDHSEFIEVAKQVAEQNGISNIQFEKINSRFFNPPEKADVILHEQIGDELFDENMVENILDMKRRVLKKGGKILPGRFELYMEPFSFKEDFRVPHIWELNVEGFDFTFLNERESIKNYMNKKYSVKFIESYSVDFLLCDPTPVMKFDLNDDNLDLNLSTQKKEVVRPGRMDGICVYFKTLFDDEIFFDTSPINKRTSWGNIYFRTPGLTYEAGDTISFSMEMDSILLSDTWSLQLHHHESPVHV